MTIREVLESDWSVDKIDITVRDKDTTRYIMQYCIGKDVKAGKSQRFAYETKIGDVYKDSGMKTLFIPRIIQHRQLERKPQGKEMCIGVLTSKIPKEILDLHVGNMSPYDCGKSSELHGYRFNCYVDAWNGIPDENAQVEFSNLN